MYSPFRNEQGQPKSLDEVAYADLAQLKDLEEGFALEFKRTWNENVRAKIPKIIASFANSHGGWAWSSASPMTIKRFVLCQSSRQISLRYSASCAATMYPLLRASTHALSPILQTPNKAL